MSTRVSLAFTTPSWALSLLSRTPSAPSTRAAVHPLSAPPSPSQASQTSLTPVTTRATAQPSPSAMRELIVQWLTHMRDDPQLKRVLNASNTLRNGKEDDTQQRTRRSLLWRLGAWVAVILRLPARRALPPSPSAAQAAEPSPRRNSRASRARRSSSAATVKRGNSAAKVTDSTLKPRAPQATNVSPLYQSLYFSQRWNASSAEPARCITVAMSVADEDADVNRKSSSCVMPFFLVESGLEGRGILERLKEVHSTGETQPKPRLGPLAWVPAVVSFTLIALNPLK